MKIVTVGNGQSIYDISIQEGGGVDFVFQLMAANPDVITSLDTILTAGVKLNIPDTPVNTDVRRYYQDKKLKPATGDDVTVGENPLLNLNDEILKNINDSILYNLNNNG